MAKRPENDKRFSIENTFVLCEQLEGGGSRKVYETVDNYDDVPEDILLQIQARMLETKQNLLNDGVEKFKKKKGG